MPFPSPGFGQWITAGLSTAAAIGFWKPDGVRTATQIFGGNDGWLGMPNLFGGPYYDTDHDELIYDASGGHGDYPGNETTRLSTETQIWDRPAFTIPTAPGTAAGTSLGTPGVLIPSTPASTFSYIDTGGTFGPVNQVYPASTHRYHGSCYMRTQGSGLHIGGVFWSLGNPSPEVYLHSARAASLSGAWTRINSNVPAFNRPNLSCCEDTALGIAYVYNASALWSVNPVTGAATRVTNDGGTTSGNSNQDVTILFDPKRRRVVRIGPLAHSFETGPGIAYVDLFKGGTHVWEDLNTTGAIIIRNIGSLGGIYDEVRDRYVYYNAGTGFPASLFFVDPDTGVITQETGTGTTPPVGNIPNGPYGNFFRSVNHDAYGLVVSFNTAPFYYRPALLSPRVFSMPLKTWTGQPYPGFGMKLRAGFGTKHMHSFSDESRQRLVFIGGDTPTGGGLINNGSTQGSDSNTDVYDPRTQAWGHLAARRFNEGGTSTNMIDCPDNICCVHDTTNDRYMASIGFYGDGVTLDNSCGTGNHGTALPIATNISLLDPATAQWSIGPALSSLLVPAVGGDGTTGQGDYDPIGTRMYMLVGGGNVLWYNTVANTWGLQRIANVDVAGNGKLHREHARVDIYGRKIYFIDPALGRLAFMSINLLDGTFGTNGYVTNSAIPNFAGPLPTDHNLSMHFDSVNRLVMIPLIGGYAGYVYSFSVYHVDTGVWETFPLTSTDFPGGQTAGSFVCGSECVYDRAHNVLLLHSGNSDPTGTTFAVPAPTKFALWRYWGGPSTAVPALPPPTLVSVSPPSAVAGGLGFTITATGTNFVAGAGLLWNGGTRTTTVLNSTTLTATILASDIAVAGSATVTVLTSSGTSNPLIFSITSPATTVPALLIVTKIF